MKPETFKALNEALIILSQRCNETSYGHFYGGDPRDFHPDEECSTESEREAHRLACEAAELDEKARNLPGSHQRVQPADAERLIRDGKADSAIVAGAYAHVHMKGFGLGTTTFRDDELERVAEAIDAALADARGGQ